MIHRLTTLMLSFLVVACMNADDSSKEPALLSAQVDRLEEMMQSCRENLDLSAQGCQCIFTRSLDTSLSNYDLSEFFYDGGDRLSQEKTSALRALEKRCRINLKEEI